MSDDLRFTPAILVTGQDERGNEFCWWFANDKFVDAYNEREVSEQEFRGIYPQVGKVYLDKTIMTGDEWRELQCPLSMSIEQLGQWQEAKRILDWVGETPNRIEDMLSGDPARIMRHIPKNIELRRYSSFPRRRSAPLSAEEVEGEY